jgi:hypothetical protein
MFDVQTIGVLVTAASVSVAAIYYIMTLRVQQENMKATLQTRRINLIATLSTNLLTREGMRDHYEILSYEWSDYEDFSRKYGQRSNPEAAIKRHLTWLVYNNMGAMLRKGMVEAEDLYDGGIAVGVILMWEKYGQLINQYARSSLNGKDYCSDFEYLAGEMFKEKRKRDPTYRVPDIFAEYAPDK